MNYLIRLKGELYHPQMIRDSVGRDILDLTPVSCGTCRKYSGCEKLANANHGNIADRCEKWTER